MLLIRGPQKKFIFTYPGFYDLLKYNFALYFWMLCFHYRHWGVGAYCDNASIPCLNLYLLLLRRCYNVLFEWI